MSLGQIIAGKYQILKRIDQNEKVNVFSGIEINSEKEVIIKILKKQWLQDDDLVEQFSNETNSLVSLKNPNIAEIYDVDYIDGIYYIAMEYIKGDSLFSIIKKKVELPIIVIINIITQLNTALKDAYKNNIKYRTLKLSNILLQKDGFIKIINFNIPRSILSSTTKDISENIGIGPDIFFLGLLMYELITFKFPLKEKYRIVTDIKMLSKFNMQNELLIENRDIPKEEKRELENIIFKSTTKELDFRYNTFEEFQKDIDQWCKKFYKKDKKYKKDPITRNSASFILNEMDKITKPEQKKDIKKDNIKIINTKKIFDDNDDNESSLMKKLWMMWFLIGITVILALILKFIW